MVTDYQEIRFGIIAFEKGFVTHEQIIKALEIQATENITTGKHRLIGEIMVEMGSINTSQVGEVLEAQSKEA